MDGTISAAHAVSIAQLFEKAIQEHPPKYPTTLPANRWMLPLGAYLVSLGYLTPQELEAVLDEQTQARQRGVNEQLGTLLVQMNLVEPQVVAAVILVQMIDRLMFHNITHPAPTP
jgi:hypothetical protein